MLTDDLVLPHNLEAEKALLGAILLKNAALDLIAGQCEAEAFYRDAHQRIFSAMVHLRNARTAIDLVTLKNYLAEEGALDTVGGPAYISALINGLPQSSNIAYYAGIVREHAQRRQIIRVANVLLQQAYNHEPADLVLDHGVQQLCGLANTSTNGVTSIGQAAQAYTESLDANRGVGLSTGFVDLDDVLGVGLAKQHLIMLAARPNVGKSTWIMNVASEIASKQVPVALFSLEMSDLALGAQALTMTAGVDSVRLRRKLLNQTEWVKVSDALMALADRPLYLLDSARRLTQIQAWGRRLKESHAIQLLVIDYIQQMVDERSRDQQQEIAMISRGLKTLARDLDLPVLAVSQLNRASEHRTDKRPQLAELRGSGVLEQDADIVLLLFRPDLHSTKEADQGIVEVIVAKNRYGPTGTVKLAFVKQHGKFANLAHGE